jgi:hypothetical protein
MTWICSVRPRLTPHRNHIGCSRFGFEPGHARLIGACLNFPRVCRSEQGCRRSNPNAIANDGFQFCRRARLNDVRAPVRANIKQTKAAGYGPVDFSASAKPFRLNSCKSRSCALEALERRTYPAQPKSAGPKIRVCGSTLSYYTSLKKAKCGTGHCSNSFGSALIDLYFPELCRLLLNPRLSTSSTRFRNSSRSSNSPLWRPSSTVNSNG